MNENTIVISLERYEELIKNEAKLEVIRDVIAQDDSSYGFSESTAKAVEAVLGLIRSVEK